MARARWKMPEAYTQHVLSLLPRAGRRHDAQSPGIQRPSGFVLTLNIQKNAIVRPTDPFTFRKRWARFLAVRA